MRRGVKRGAALLAMAAVTGLLVAWWYLTRCEGRWDGQPLEATRAAELAALEQDLRRDVEHLAVSIGERNLRDEERYRALQAAGEYIRQRWEAQGYAVREQTFAVQGKEVRNLEVEIPGRLAPDQIVVVSAQYDTLPGSPGANNNASGEAVLLALSKMLGRQPLDRTLRLVSFTTEEDPYFGTEQMGSYHYARRCRERREAVRVMLSLDSIGYYKHERHTQHLPFPFSLLYPDTGDFLGFIGNLPSRRAVVETTRGFKKGSAFPVEAGLAPAWVPGTSWSDHSSFWKFGYRAVQITDTGGFRSPFHTNRGDTLDKIDFPALARVTFGMYGSVLELTTMAR